MPKSRGRKRTTESPTPNKVQWSHLFQTACVAFPYKVWRPSRGAWTTWRINIKHCNSDFRVDRDRGWCNRLFSAHPC
jgi:hypothetical protein